jgi:hypothetical protein
MPMCSLTAHKPLHVVNMALILVGGKNLAWQQRKAEPFTSTRLHTGGCRVGYRPSTEYGGSTAREQPRRRSRRHRHDGFRAAASPNMGYNSSPLLTIVMTLFNARLGWWIKNPNRPGWDAGSPSLALPLLLELLGQTDERKRYIHLSDGGHFENLGVYELIRRRCRYIVCCDAGTDPEASDDNLGNAAQDPRRPRHSDRLAR